MEESLHLTLFDLALDNGKKNYSAGDKVSGMIRINLTGQLHITHLKIKLVCLAEVKWTENPGTHYHREGHVYYDKKKFLDFSYAMSDQYHNAVLKAGQHEVPFSFKLPEQDIPSSFSSPHGSVTYFVEAIIDESGEDEAHKVGTEIVVDAPFRGNLKLSIGDSVEKDFDFLSLGSGKITLYADLNRKGFFPGESIELHIIVDNCSTVEATPRATLYQRQVYMCEERHKAFEDALSPSIVGTTVEKKTKKSESLYLRIPKHVSFTIKSGIVNVKYFLHVTLDIPHAFDIHVNLPIVITSEKIMSSE